jgi:hypothetical protein
LEKSGLNYDKPPDIKNLGIPESRQVINGSCELIDEYTNYSLENGRENTK